MIFRRMIGVDIFSGAGGMSLGAEWAGVSVKVAIEADQFAAATYSHNHVGTDVIQRDIRDVRKLKFERKKGEPLIVFGGPPCQGFSTSNQRTRSLSNPTNWLFKEYLRIVKQTSPDWVVFENVKGILETENGLFFEYILKGIEKLGYTTSHFVLNAKDYGIAQNRSRLFVIGSKNGINVSIPAPSNKKPYTVNDALHDLPVLQNGDSFDVLPYASLAMSVYARRLRRKWECSPNHHVTWNAPHIIERYKHIPQGGNWESIPEHLMKNYTDRTRCHTGIYRRLESDKPSVVIGNFRKNMLVHPTQDRGLSIREAARLQSFPDSYEFKGTIGFQQQQVGNAVPPLLAKAVFKQILRVQ
jgi:DNA (cytosine-5)-methyltransferase 1